MYDVTLTATQRTIASTAITKEHREQTTRTNRPLMVLVWALTIGSPIAGLFAGIGAGLAIGLVSGAVANIVGTRASVTEQTIERETWHG